MPELILFGDGPHRWSAFNAHPTASALALPRSIRPETYRVSHPTRAALTPFLQWLQHQQSQGRTALAVLGYEACLSLSAPLPAPDKPNPQPSVPAAYGLAFPSDALRPLPLTAPPSRPPDFTALRSQRGAYLQALQRTQAAMHRGALDQVNITTSSLQPAPHPPPPATVAAAISAAQPIPYGLALQTRDFSLYSGSMECAFLVRQGQIIGRPIKGTAPRSSDPTEDQAAGEALQSNPKERHENTIVTDLLVREFEKICLPGTVHTPARLRLTPYRTLWHLESEVTGQLPPDIALASLLSTLLPATSITGVPRHAAITEIHRTETLNRGLYCGAIGLLHPNQDSDWSVSIRTLVHADAQLRAQVGSGIVSASHPETEWEELFWKARAPLGAWRSASMAHLPPDPPTR